MNKFLLIDSGLYSAVARKTKRIKTTEKEKTRQSENYQPPHECEFCATQ